MSEAKAKADTLKDARERIAELRERQSERSTEGDKRMRAAVASYDKREEDVRKRLDEYTKGTFQYQSRGQCLPNASICCLQGPRGSGPGRRVR